MVQNSDNDKEKKQEKISKATVNRETRVTVKKKKCVKAITERIYH